MDRINADGHVGHRFVEEDLSVFRRPTQLSADWFNSVQEEIVSVINAAGINLDVSQEDQLLQALQILFGGNASEANAGVLALATEAETIAGAISSKATHPAGVSSAIAAAIASKLNTSVFAYFLSNPARSAALLVSDLSTSLVSSAWVKFGFDYSFTEDVLTKIAHSYIKLPAWMGGIIVQFGHVHDGTSNNEVITKTFPIPFPNECNFCALLGTAGYSSGDAATEGAEVTAKSLTSFTVVSAWTGNPASGGGYGAIENHDSYPAMPWIAIGR